jgi:hypothetical protein
LENVKRTEYGKYLRAVGRIILKHVEMGCESENWTYLVPVAGNLEHDNEISESIKHREFLPF